MYRPRDAEHTVLHQVIAEHVGAFLDAVTEAGDGAGMPQFVEREFREFLLCGVFEAGAARFQCEDCGREHLVPFSCKGRRAAGTEPGRESRPPWLSSKRRATGWGPWAPGSRRRS